MARPKGSKNKRRKIRRAKCKGLRIAIYTDMPSSLGGSVSGYADQFGRILEEFTNSKGELDIRPTGHCIAARH